MARIPDLGYLGDSAPLLQWGDSDVWGSRNRKGTTVAWGAAGEHLEVGQVIPRRVGPVQPQEKEEEQREGVVSPIRPQSGVPGNGTK